MKRHYTNIGRVALYTLAVGLIISCGKDELSGGKDDTVDGAVSFTATLEKDIETKTTLSGMGGTTGSTTISWNADKTDKITVNEVELNMMTLESGVATFGGGGTVSKKGDYYIALYYPDNLQALDPSAITWGATDGSLSFPFPQTQTYGGSTVSNLVPMVAVSKTASLTFKSACSIIDIRMSGYSSFEVGKIVLTSASNCLSGSVSVSSDGTCSFTASGSGPSSITLNVPSDATPTLSADKTDFCIVVPAISSETTLTISIYKKGDDSQPCTTGQITVGGSSSPSIDFGELTRINTDIILPGIFKVGEYAINSGDMRDICVKFSKGNLQYQASTNTFKFAEQQWYHYSNGTNPLSNGGNLTIGEDERATQSDWIDMFAYGCSGAEVKEVTTSSGYVSGTTTYATVTYSPANYIYSDKMDKYHYGLFDIADTDWEWGYHLFPNQGWRTLSATEWTNLLTYNTYGRATVSGVQGIIVVPYDNWSDPKTNEAASSGGSFVSGSSTLFNSNVYTGGSSVSSWSKMEANGALFLPFSNGIRYNDNASSTDVEYNNTGNGYYWSCSKKDYYNGQTADNLKAKAFYFSSSSTGTSDFYENNGCFVRLVKYFNRYETTASDYVDEYGFNRGPGIVSGSYTWAPIDCGQHPYLTCCKNGKQYQWGRKDGQPVSSNESSYGSSITKNFCYDDTERSGVLNKAFFYSNKSSATNYKRMWTTASISSWTNDPCPDGWRVPTKSELNTIIGSSSVTLSLGFRYDSYWNCKYSNVKYYWTSTNIDASNAYAYDSADGVSYCESHHKGGGAKVRCIKE